MCVCVFSSHSFWTSSSLDVRAGVTQEEGRIGLIAVIGLIALIAVIALLAVTTVIALIIIALLVIN